MSVLGDLIDGCGNKVKETRIPRQTETKQSAMDEAIKYPVEVNFFDPEIEISIAKETKNPFLIQVAKVHKY